MAEAQPLRGLSEQEADRRLALFGPNLVSEPRFRSVLTIARETLREPMFLLLVAAAALYLVVGDLADGIFLSIGALLSLSLVIIQEARSERALRALNALAEPKAQMIRDGRVQAIPAKLLVPGDLLVVAEGGRIPADALLIEGQVLEVDESILTGEAAASTKVPGASGPATGFPPPGDDGTPFLFASTVVVRGHGIAEVARTGAKTEAGRIGVALRVLTEEPTLLQRDIRRLIGFLGVFAVIFCAIVATAYGLIRNDWFAGVLAGLTLAISLIPEEFPMVLTIFMALGAWRLAKHNVLVRRSAVIETLGATTLLCVDKTGTLTENRMALRRIWSNGGETVVGEASSHKAAAAIEIARLASAPWPVDPMDIAIHAAAGGKPEGQPLRSYPLRPQFLAFTQVWPAKDGGVVYAVKGAHEAVLPLCTTGSRSLKDAEKAAHALGERGMRVLAVASARFPGDPGLEPDEVDYELEGLLGFEDPVRSDVPAALREAAAAGVGVAMITGDFPATARAAAAAIGIPTALVVSGKELASAAGIPAEARIFARIMPDQKLGLVQGFRQAGHVVAMTGDGINDAPALAAADIGIAMGRRGTDVAREASDLILLDDRFASIVGGIRLGRRIFANLRRAMGYIAAVHIPVAGLALLPILLGFPPLFFPMHLVLLELMLDPLASLVFEGEPSAKDAMKKPPRNRDEALFGRREVVIAALEGAVLLATVLALYAWLITSGEAEGVSRASAFTALVAGHLTLALATGVSTKGSLFAGHRVIFWLVTAGAVLILAAAMTIPLFEQIFRFAAPPHGLLFASVVVGVVAGGWPAILHLERKDTRRLATA